MAASYAGGAMTAAVAVLGALFALGLIALVAGLRRRPAAGGGPALAVWRRFAERLPARWTRRQVALAVLAGVAVGALTGWPVAAVLTTAGALTLPGLLGPDKEAARSTERLEALATWTEMLRDTLSAAAGLDQTVLATADIPPAALETELRALGSTVRAGRPLPAALRDFAEEVGDPLADVVVAALVMAAQKQASQLAGLLGELADSVREQVAMRQRIEAGRASIRTGVRVTVLVTLGMVAALVTFNRPYLDPFDSLTGQAVLATVGGLFALAFAWLTAIGRIDAPGRLLAPAPASEEGR